MNNTIATLAIAVVLTACAPPQPLISQFTAVAPTDPIEGTIYSLPLARLQVTVDTSKGEFSATPVIIPDPNATYVLSAQFGLASTDDFDLTTSNQLLSSINATATDEVQGIVTSVLNAIPANTLSGLRAEAPESGALVGTFLIDPYHRGEGAFRIEAADPTIFRRVGTQRDQCPEGSSVCVPMLTPITVSVATGTFSASAIVMVPDPTRVVGINLRQSACSQTSNALTFQNGIMTKYDVTRPSAVANCLKVPLDIIGAIFAAPLQALNDETATVVAETNLLTAQVQLLNAQVALANAQASE